jgi:hypothetical protein
MTEIFVKHQIPSPHFNAQQCEEGNLEAIRFSSLILTFHQLFTRFPGEWPTIDTDGTSIYIALFFQVTYERIHNQRDQVSV